MQKAYIEVLYCNDTVTSWTSLVDVHWRLVDLDTVGRWKDHIARWGHIVNVAKPARNREALAHGKNVEWKA